MKPTEDQIERAGQRWSDNMVARHTSRGCLAYFRAYWRSMPELRAFVEQETQTS